MWQILTLKKKSRHWDCSLDIYGSSRLVGRAKLRCAVKGRLNPVGGRYPARQLTFQPEAVEAMRTSDRPVEALDAKGSLSEPASVQTTMKIERRVSLEKPNVPVEIVGARRRPKSGREESVKSIFREDRGSGGGMCAKDRRVNTGDPAQCKGKGPSNRRSARIGAGLSWESERFVVAMKRVMIVERRDLSSRATLEVTRGKRLVGAQGIPLAVP